MKKSLGFLFLFIFTLACSHTKNLAQAATMPSNDLLLQHIDSSAPDTDLINPHLKALQRENDLVIALGTLNYAWARRGTFYALTQKNNSWALYSYQSKLPPSAEDEAATLTPQTVSGEAAEKIKQLYTASGLWETGGDNGESFCSGAAKCNINDAETWTLSVATPHTIHTTTYYAPDFFEQCCPGNLYRQHFVALAKELIKLAPSATSAQEK